MVKQHNQTMVVCLGVCDLLMIAAAWWGAYWLRFYHMPSPRGIATLTETATNGAIAALLSLLVLMGIGLYRPRRDRSFMEELAQIIKATLLTWVVLMAMLFMMMRPSSSPFTRGMLLIFLPLMAGTLIVERGIFRSILRFARRRGWNLRHTLIVGTGRLGQSTLHKLRENSWTGIRVAGFVEAHPTGRRTVRGVPVLGSADRVVEIIERTGADSVFVAIGAKHGELLRRVIQELEQTTVDVRIVPDLFLSRFPMEVRVTELDGMPVLGLRENPLAGWPGMYKRVFDVCGALFGLMLFGPMMLVIAAWVKVQDGGPIIYRQRRISLWGRAFDMYKFRTMKMDAEVTGAAFATKNDPRCTWLGRYLRSMSLDELPQLVNVLMGDMSLVGPRPERPEMLAKIRQEIPAFPMRMRVRAGLTGWAQVNGFRGRTSFRKRLQYDMYYLNNWSPMLDLRIVIATVFKGFRHPNAY